MLTRGGGFPVPSAIFDDVTCTQSSGFDISNTSGLVWDVTYTKHFLVVFGVIH